MHCRIIFAVSWVLLLLCRYGYAQESDSTFTYDRPGIADSPFLIPPKHLKFEVGFDYHKRQSEGIENTFYPILFFRTGVTQNLELRFSGRYMETRFLDKKDSVYRGIGTVTAGMKLRICDQKGWIPYTALITNIALPQVGNTKLVPQFYGHDMILAFHNNVTSSFGINYNVGMAWDGNEANHTWLYSACFNWSHHAIGFFAEHYAFIPNQKQGEYGFDAGVVYLLLPTLQLDISAGITWKGKAQNQFISAGFAVRLY